jgi:hypothetical protein
MNEGAIEREKRRLDDIAASIDNIEQQLQRQQHLSTIGNSSDSNTAMIATMKSAGSVATASTSN